ncbi:hypothetical protein NQ317_009199 [Molorchus minor]|uniref:Uncharacterized protein n=1 Tax=Molorchus minor TaxID=1323400 RepID=A0ABQ9JBI4_9CUCU|nr:hypothetical protein NQ317_009199 [Molorchus minor]
MLMLLYIGTFALVTPLGKSSRYGGLGHGKTWEDHWNDLIVATTDYAHYSTLGFKQVFNINRSSP